MSEHTPLTEADRVTGEQVYNEHGWSGCDGSRWDRLPPATQDGWNFAADALAARTSTATADTDNMCNAYYTDEIGQDFTEKVRQAIAGVSDE